MFISKKKNISIIKKLPIIKSIIGDEMNKECFDCGSPNPEFISINNAIFLCRNCSYLHKQFPDEISEIISNNLYKLDEKELYYLYYGGNRKLSEFIYLNPKLSKYKSDILYKMNEMKFYRDNLSNIINEKLGINESIENYKYIKNNNYNNWNNFNTLNLKRKYNRRKILYLNEKDNFENIIDDSKLARFSTTNKVPKKYKKRYIPELEDKYQNNRISVHNRNPAILLDMDYSQDIKNHSNKNSNLVWLNNSNYESDSKNKGYGNLGKTSFNYKNYINNTININNSNNNNFYFNQSESDIDKKYNMRNTSNSNYLTFYNKFKFEIPKKNKIPSTVNSSFNLSTFIIYSKPRLPKCGMNLKNIKNNTKSLNFSGYKNYYTMQNVNNNNYNNSKITDNKKLTNIGNDRNNRIGINNTINNIRNKYSKIKSKISERKNLFELNYLSDDISKINGQHKQIKFSNIINSNDYLPNNYNNLNESDKVQNLSILDEIETKNNSTEKKLKSKKRKEYRKKYLERKNFEKEERKKMEKEEKRRKEELKKIMDEKNKNKKQNKKKLTKKERLKLIEEERLSMQKEEMKAKKKKAFENRVIKEEDEEYEQELETPKGLNMNISESDKIKESNLNFVKTNNNSNTKINANINNNNINNKKDRNDEIVDTFKNSIRNRYKRKKNKL